MRKIINKLLRAPAKEVDRWEERHARLGAEVPLSDPLDRGIMLVFELVAEHKLDPLDVDLAKFVNLYLEKVKSHGFDLTVAGYLVFRAWKVLKLQSDEVLAFAQPTQEEPEMPSEWWEEAVVKDKLPVPRLEERVRRKGKRKVTLWELIEAFEEARKTVKARKVRVRKGKEYMARGREEVSTRMHYEILEEQIKHLWERIRDADKKPFSYFCKGGKDEWVLNLIALLYLAEQGKIKVWQSKFPEGDIYVRRA